MFLQAQGLEPSEIFDLTSTPSEFLKDPTGWVEAHEVEDFLRQIENLSVMRLGVDRLFERVGHASVDLKAWGVLDSVLRMIEKPNDIFLQPQRFISYFISPAPPIANIKRHLHAVAFDIPISFEEYPCVATYLRAAIEGVPHFMGAQLAEATWRQNSLSISWDQTQSLLDEQALRRRHMAPEVMQTLVATLEKTEQALVEKTRELDRIKSENALAAQSQVPQMTEFIQFRKQYAEFHQKVLKLQDYFTRSQQLITLLIGQDRMNSQVREAIKRVNWEAVQAGFPKITQELLNHFENSTEETNASIAESENATNYENPRARDSRQPWLPYN
jgi:hypothetical protein